MLKELMKPFDLQDIEWRAGSTNQAKTKALALAYITSRAVMDRLDEVVGPENWRDEYKPGPDGGIMCGLSIRIDGEWITKWDGAENTNYEPVKGGMAGAFKRAGVKWGIGRYLYKLDSQWVACEQRGKSVVLTEKPGMPTWALPTKRPEPAKEKTVRQTKKQPPIPNTEVKHQNIIKWMVEEELVKDQAEAKKLYDQLELFQVGDFKVRQGLIMEHFHGDKMESK